jgi:hypothetical protein
MLEIDRVFQGAEGRAHCFLPPLDNRLHSCFPTPKEQFHLDPHLHLHVKLLPLVVVKGKIGLSH